MDFTVRVKEGHEKTLETIKKFCEATNTTYLMKEYSMMVTVKIDTTSKDSRISGYIVEERYLNGNYGLRIYHRDDYETSIFIPLKDLDEIYNL